MPKQSEVVEVTKLSPEEKTGLVVVITGHGKGKTTAALGITLRACGHNMGVCIIQFMKGDIYAGERDGVKKMESGQFDVLILDEINNALHLKLVDLEQVLEIIRRKPPQMHLVLTGRDAHHEVIELADTVSEIIEVKHAYRKEIEPQPGIDY